jgi:predicted GNAT superfamily acetyltransferase
MKPIAPPTAVAPSRFAEAARDADEAARRAGVSVAETESMPELRETASLMEAFGGRGPDGVPIGSELMRSPAHAGGAVTVARAADGTLAGAAVLTPAAPAGATYSLIAAAAPGAADRGVGRALKLRQRAWALGQGHRVMRWTFDPLVGRNAAVIRHHRAGCCCPARGPSRRFVDSRDLSGRHFSDRRGGP